MKVYHEVTTSVRVFVNFGRISHFFSVSIVDFEQTNADGITKCRVVVPFWKTSAVFCSFTQPVFNWPKSTRETLEQVQS